jgi:UDP-N-acetylglucosamine 2-epimerase (non-hydrolysing)
MRPQGQISQWQSTNDKGHEIKNLEFLIINILKFTRKHKIIFPIHPRIAKKLNFQQYKNLICIEPLEYLQFNFLIKNALGVITDSGGITEETTVLNIPCITFLSWKVTITFFESLI